MAHHKTQVVILTGSFRIEGEIDLIQGARMTDFMNEANEFMVVTNATVSDHNGRVLAEEEFVNVRVENIEVALPSDTRADRSS